jgi:hypothetical protein
MFAKNCLAQGIIINFRIYSSPKRQVMNTNNSSNIKKKIQYPLGRTHWDQEKLFDEKTGDVPLHRRIFWRLGDVIFSF